MLDKENVKLEKLEKKLKNLKKPSKSVKIEKNLNLKLKFINSLLVIEKKSYYWKWLRRRRGG